MNFRVFRVRTNPNMFNILTIFILSITYITRLNALMYPASSSISLTSSVSVPITELLPDRRAIIDWCFNMAYDLPYNVSSFYNIPIWPNLGGHKTKRALYNTEEQHTHPNFFEKYSQKSQEHGNPKDFSAGELYSGIEDLLHGYGYHETCLLRSVCELARHPFDEEHTNVLTDVISFVLTPSQHEGFLPTEHIYKEAYEQAEQQGFLGQDCAQIYNECKWDILNSLTKVLIHNS